MLSLEAGRRWTVLNSLFLFSVETSYYYDDEDIDDR